ncbi:MAG: zinc ribbon domain-containing protein [Candidatus Brocadiia bacterium]
MVSFNCLCGKKLQVRDELAGKMVKCPGCANVNLVPPPLDMPIDLKPLDDNQPKAQTFALNEADESSEDETMPCPTCESPIPPESFVCPKCGVHIKDDPSQMDSAAMAFYKRFRAFIPIIVGGIIILIALLLIPKPKQEEPKKTKKPKAASGSITATATAAKEPAGPKLEDNLRAEIKNGDTMQLDGMVNLLVTLQDKAIGVLNVEVRNSDANIRLKAAYGLYFFSYYKCLRKEIFRILDACTGSKPPDDRTRLLVLEMLYLLQTDEPMPQLSSMNDIVGPHAAKFGGLPTQPPVSAATAKMLIQKYNTDKSDLIKAKALIMTITLGDRFQVRALFNILKGSDTDALALVKSYLNNITDQSFEKPEEWEEWYKANKDKIQFDKKVAPDVK